MAKAASTDTPFEGHTERITSPGRIAGLLARVRERHTLVNVFLPDQRKPYNSVILNVDVDKQTVELDELSPTSGHALLLAAGSLQIKTRLDGVDISCECSLIEVDQEDDIAFYRMSLPEVLLYRQQRAHYRVPITASLSLPIQLRRDDGEEFEGQLRDISAGGVGIRFTIDRIQGIEQGETIPHCSIALPDGQNIHSAIEIRYVDQRPKGKFCLVGACFTGLSPQDERTIAQLVVTLDRERRKRS